MDHEPGRLNDFILAVVLIPFAALTGVVEGGLWVAKKLGFHK